MDSAILVNLKCLRKEEPWNSGQLVVCARVYSLRCYMALRNFPWWLFLQDANCGNTLLISLEELVKDGLLTKEELPQPMWVVFFLYIFIFELTVMFEINCMTFYSHLCFIFLLYRLCSDSDRVNYPIIANLKNSLISKVNSQKSEESLLLLFF